MAMFSFMAPKDWRMKPNAFPINCVVIVGAFTLPGLSIFARFTLSTLTPLRKAGWSQAPEAPSSDQGLLWPRLGICEVPNLPHVAFTQENPSCFIACVLSITGGLLSSAVALLSWDVCSLAFVRPLLIFSPKWIDAIPEERLGQTWSKSCSWCLGIKHQISFFYSHSKVPKSSLTQLCLFRSLQRLFRQSLQLFHELYRIDQHSHLVFHASYCMFSEKYGPPL